MEPTISSYFLFPIITYRSQIYHLYANNVSRKGKNKSQKRPGKAHIINAFVSLGHIG